MIRKNRKGKGFTIVELVIVIAVIAILAAVLIPTFASIINKANESADIQAAKQMNIALAAESITEKPESIYDVIDILADAGFNSEKALIPVTKGCAFYWYKPENLIVLANIEGAEATAQVASILILPVSAADGDPTVSLLFPNPEDQAQDLVDAIVDAIKKFLAGDDDSGIFDLAHGKEYLELLNNGSITRVTSVTLDQTTLNMTIGDAPITLTETLTPENPTFTEVMWSSSDDEVAKVDADGRVTAVGDGTAIITVRPMVEGEGGCKAECIVTVTHTHIEVSHEAKAPTCTETGWDAYVTCSKCDYTTKVEKAALGHDEVSHDAQDPTCTEIGWDAYVTCSRCDYTTYAEEAALGHNYTPVVTPPNCTDQGYTTHTCGVCGDSYVDDYVDALDHTDAANDGDHRCDRTGCNEDNITEHTGEGTCEECDASLDDSTPISSLEELVAVLTNGGKAKLTAEEVKLDVATVVPQGVTVTLDLNGKKLILEDPSTTEDAFHVIQVFGTLNINDNTKAGEIVIEPEKGNNWEAYSLCGICIGDPDGEVAGGELNLDGVNITGNRECNIENYASTSLNNVALNNVALNNVAFTVNAGTGLYSAAGTVDIKDSTLVADGVDTCQIYCVGGTMNITDTIFDQGDDFGCDLYAYAPIMVEGEGIEVTLTGVEVNTKNNIPSIDASGCTVVIKNGTFTGDLKFMTATITIDGGEPDEDGNYVNGGTFGDKTFAEIYDAIDKGDADTAKEALCAVSNVTVWWDVTCANGDITIITPKSS